MRSTPLLLIAFAVFVWCSDAYSTPTPEAEVVGDSNTRPYQAPVPCVTPAQWEGRFSEWNHTTLTNNRYLVSYDGVKKRKYLEEERKSMRPGRRLFKFLMFYDEKVEYKIDEKNNQCTKLPLNLWRNYSIPPGALFEDNYMMGGPKGRLNVSEWSDRQPARKKESWIGGFAVNGCWPVFEIFTSGTNENDTTGFTTRFFDITLGIKNMSVFDLPKICTSAAPTPSAAPTSPAKTSFWDRWTPKWIKTLFGKQKIDNGGIKVPRSDDVTDATSWMETPDPQTPNEDEPSRIPMIPINKSKRQNVRTI